MYSIQYYVIKFVSWINNYLCNQCWSPLNVVSSNPVHSELHSIQHSVIKFVSHLLHLSGFLHQENWPPRYNWNIVESGVKHNSPNPYKLYVVNKWVITYFFTTWPIPFRLIRCFHIKKIYPIWKSYCKCSSSVIFV